MKKVAGIQFEGKAPGALVQRFIHHLAALGALKGAKVVRLGAYSLYEERNSRGTYYEFLPYDHRRYVHNIRRRGGSRCAVELVVMGPWNYVTVNFGRKSDPGSAYIGCQRKTLEQWLGEPGVEMAEEYGAKTKVQRVYRTIFQAALNLKREEQGLAKEHGVKLRKPAAKRRKAA